MTSTDYHDYVIKDGRFIGAFEEMYRNCPDPWRQDDNPPLTEDLALLLVSKREKRYQRVLDLGCGKGRFTNRLRHATGATVSAVDISPTAIKTACSRYPDIEFIVGSVPPLGFPDESFDLVVTSELLWYVLPKLSALLNEIKRVLRVGGHYLIIQQFYSPEEQRYGRELMQTPEDLLSLVPFSLETCVEVSRGMGSHKLLALAEKAA